MLTQHCLYFSQNGEMPRIIGILPDLDFYVLVLVGGKGARPASILQRRYLGYM
jgi:hypothetical protein